jgi:hypothetical protein
VSDHTDTIEAWVAAQVAARADAVEERLATFVRQAHTALGPCVGMIVETDCTERLAVEATGALAGWSLFGWAVGPDDRGVVGARMAFYARPVRWWSISDRREWQALQARVATIGNRHNICYNDVVDREGPPDEGDADDATS